MKFFAEPGSFFSDLEKPDVDERSGRSVESLERLRLRARVQYLVSTNPALRRHHSGTEHPACRPVDLEL